MIIRKELALGLHMWVSHSGSIFKLDHVQAMDKYSKHVKSNPPIPLPKNNHVQKTMVLGVTNVKVYKY